MNNLKRILLTTCITIACNSMFAQFNNSGIVAGFFDSSEEKSINFSEFHLPPLAVLFENAKSTPGVLTLIKAQEIAQAEVAKQKRHIFSYLRGNASYSYGRTDVWTASSSNFAALQQVNTNGTDQVFWNIGVSLNLPLEDILDLSASVKRKKLAVDQAVLAKDIAFDNLKKEIAALYIKITNSLVSLKTASENAAMYQGAGALNLEEFHQGNMEIEAFAYTKQREEAAVSTYQGLQTQIITDIITLELLTHTPIITNTTTEITLESNNEKSPKEIRRENRAIEKRIRQATSEDERRIRQLERAENEAARKAVRAARRQRANN